MSRTRLRAALAVAALALTGVLAAVLIAGGVASARWRTGGSGQATARAAVGAEVRIDGPGSPAVALLPGATADLAVTVTNPGMGAARLTAVAPTGPVSADAAHAACPAGAVVTTAARFSVAVTLAAGASTRVDLPGAVAMAADAPTSCQGATFAVPVRVEAVTP